MGIWSEIRCQLMRQITQNILNSACHSKAMYCSNTWALVSTREVRLMVVREELVELFLFLADKSCTYHATFIFLNTAAKITLHFGNTGNILDTRVQDAKYKNARIYIPAPPVSSHLMLEVTLQTQWKNLRKRTCLTDHDPCIYEWPKGKERK